jgi:hypothetical protein
LYIPEALQRSVAMYRSGKELLVLYVVLYKIGEGSVEIDRRRNRGRIHSKMGGDEAAFDGLL